MAVLYVTEQGSSIRRVGQRLVVEKDREELMDIPCLKLDAVLLFGNVQFTTQAAVEMLRQGIEMSLLTHTGRLRGQLTPPKAKNIELRMRQFELFRNETFCLDLSRRLVEGKIRNGAAVLRRYRRNAKGWQPVAVRALEEKAARALVASSLESLRGVEGSAAAAYFEALGAVVPSTIPYDGRNCRPPKDPVNALLSFGYVLVGNELQSLLDAIGFDPYLGFYHQLDYGRPSLALDLVEEFRAPLVDRFSLGLLRRKILRPEHFSGRRSRGLILGREGKKRYFRAFEKEMAKDIPYGDEKLSFRQIFQRQAHGLARALEEGEPYMPFAWSC